MASKRAWSSFKRLEEDLARVRPDGPRDAVLCPFCLESFGPEALRTRTLSEEHIVPECLGGREVTLSCTRCNNTQGSRLESQLATAIEAHDASKGAGALRTTVEIGGAVARGTVSLRLGGGETNEIRLSDKVSHPAELERMAAALRNGSKEIHLTVSYGYVPARLHIGLLRVGYLVMFHKLGYSFILSPALDPIRAQIRELDPPNENLRWLSSYIPDLGPAMQMPFTAHDLSSGTGLDAYLVLARFKKVDSHAYAILLPTADIEPEHVFESLKDTAERLSETSMQITVW